MESIEKFGAYTRGLDPTSGALGIYTETNLRNVAVNCRFCGNKIPFVKPERLGVEIGLKCPKCERRMIYAAADVYPFGGPTKTQRSLALDYWHASSVKLPQRSRSGSRIAMPARCNSLSV